jgi:hypothetical protein
VGPLASPPPGAARVAPEGEGEPEPEHVPEPEGGAEGVSLPEAPGGAVAEGVRDRVAEALGGTARARPSGSGESTLPFAASAAASKPAASALPTKRVLTCAPLA